jgi:hypothetical protein
MKNNLFLIFLFISLNFCFAKNILITEVMYNPEGNDEDREWIEAINLGEDIEVKTGRNGWRIFDGENHILKGENFLWRKNEIIVFVQSISKFLSEYQNCNAKLVESSFSLGNKSETIKILDENKNQLAEFTYSSSIGGNGNGYSLIYDNGIIKQGNIKKGTPGIYPEPNIVEQKPLIQEATKTDIATKTEEKPQTTTAETKSQATTTIETIPQSTTTKEKPIPDTIIITEFLADEKGKDLNEFIEIYNYGDEKVDLSNFYLVVGSKKIKLNGFIDPNEYKVFYKNDLGFNIRNNGEILKILNKDGKDLFSIEYKGKAKTGKSFSRDEEGNWRWTTPTPGRENVFKEEVAKESSKKNREGELVSEDLENFLTPYETFDKAQAREIQLPPIFIGIFVLILIIIIFILFIK